MVKKLKATQLSLDVYADPGKLHYGIFIFMEFLGVILELFFDIATLKSSGRRWFPRLYSFTKSLILFAVIIYLLLWGIIKIYSVFTNPYSKNLKEIEVAISSYKQFHSKYPASLTELIGNDPNRSNWEIDYWGVRVSYNVSGDLQSYTFTSAGEDMIFNTNDDLRISK